MLTGRGVIRTGKGTIICWSEILMLHYPLINFEIRKCYQNETKFNGVYSKNDLTKIKDESYVINHDQYKSIRTHWIALYVNGDNVTYFDSFAVEYIPKEIQKINRQK